MTTLQQIKTPRGSDMVMKEIKASISRGEFLPGSRMPTVVELSEIFQLGRSTIREALSALKAMGWIDIRHGGGTYVSQMIPPASSEEAKDFFALSESFQEMIEVRKFIESGCAQLAAKHRTDADLGALERILGTMEAMIGVEADSEQADIDFHMQIAAASGNKLFHTMMQSLTTHIQDHIGNSRKLWFWAEPASSQQLIREHYSIYESIRDGDGQAAFDKMMDHLNKVEKEMQKRI